MYTIKNLTPYEIQLQDKAGEVIRTFKPEGLIHLNVKTVNIGEIDGVPITRTEFSEPVGLPEQRFTALAGGNAGYGSTWEEAEFDLYQTYRLTPEVIGLETYYIVTPSVKKALPEREDLLIPAKLVRDVEGNAIRAVFGEDDKDVTLMIECKSLGV